MVEFKGRSLQSLSAPVKLSVSILRVDPALFYNLYRKTYSPAYLSDRGASQENAAYFLAIAP